MYEWISQISNAISLPLLNYLSTGQGPLWSAFLLGLIGALAPCQLTGNAAALSYLTERANRGGHILSETAAYLVGKASVYLLLGVLVLWFGTSLESSLIPLFQWMRKLLGPLFVLSGLLLIGWLKLRGFRIGISDRLKAWSLRVGGRRSAFLLGFSVSLAFCPTMATLFFGWLISFVLSYGAGWVLPAVFAIGTSIPVLMLVTLGSIIGLDGTVIRRSRRFSRTVSVITGLVLILLGLFDTWTYWTL
ncbi:urease accessory protein UreH domain-containing protein [Desmospora profundinema]|uniref:Cytochrome c biogenesis protein CcdA n=1 Tax=Desmospora profundinema TaxID=1571184 RepID=A0ABU1IH49_9BACL|nr:sulfite exporter TauE/SafE family protein [Desmospora profundinema]MDR6224031.1 cytochrome c biogenesis protein CcdA [Desmospora profundinema]